MKKQVLQILQMDADAYYMLVMDCYLEWCQSKSKNQTSLQKLLISKPLFNWWYKCLEFEERKFVYQGKAYIGKLSPELAIDFYRETISPINKLFSKPLMKKAYDS
ncbi:MULTISPECIES: hypothetical protein [Bizionia]|uniref:Uncharacterized protein n=1 Tax=Bizionia algoritergicola TaxID=291187 RepID=A0A5D0QIQ7_9FLAO|nr:MULTISPECIES: hypothetical protein [Bizionia]OBX17822.1 hypothetical protein BAA08_15820 [Bizionia sp. APA-3]TYB69070.1 hypothetical protein ES675_16260 [Bizionia algoritergicola]